LADSRRIRSLDGWRALGAVLVLVSHAPFTAGFPQRYAYALTTVFDGELGVRVFFVLSGFLITYLLVQEADATGSVSLKRFYIRRALRILPIYFTYLAVLGLLTVLGLYQDALSSWIGSLTFTRNMLGRGQSATIQLWSLAVEEQFYLLWPMLLVTFALWRRPRAFISVSMLVIAACPILRATLMSPPGGSLVDRLFGRQSGLMYADSLIVGCLGAFLVRRCENVPAAFEAPLIKGFAIACVVGGRILQLAPAPAWLGALIPSVQAVAIMFLIWGTAFHPPGVLSRALNLRLVVLVGTLSYSIYVWHVLFVSNFTPRLADYWTHDWKWWMPCGVAVAAVSYYGVERPFLELKARYAGANRVAAAE
jgi:peptidoglycan/LPS O-acetylase OafA/YrhL